MFNNIEPDHDSEDLFKSNKLQQHEDVKFNVDKEDYYKSSHKHGNFKFEILAALAGGVFIAYFYILSLFFQHSLSHFLILNFNQLNISSCSQYASLLHFVYFIILLLLSNDKRVTSTESLECLIKEKGKALYVRTITKLARNLILKTAQCLLLKIKKWTIYLYQAVKLLITIFRKAEVTPLIAEINCCKHRYSKFLNDAEIKSKTPVSSHDDFSHFKYKVDDHSCAIIPYIRKYFNNIRKHNLKRDITKWKRHIRVFKFNNHKYVNISYNSKSLSYSGFQSNTTCTMNHNDTIKKINESSNEESETEETSSSEESHENKLANEFDFIGSALNIASKHSLRHKHYIFTRKGIKERYKSLLKIFNQVRDEASFKNIPFVWKRRHKEYIIMNMRDIRRAERVRIEQEWYSKQHDKIFKEPSDRTAVVKKKNEEEQNSEMQKALNVLKYCSKRKVSELENFTYEIPMPSAAGQSAWGGAPLAVKCCCPSKPDSCICKGSTLYPGKSLPFATYIPPPKNKCLYKIFAKCHIINTKKAGTFISNYETAARLENQFYRDQEGMRLVQERGPEFCFSHCHQFFETDKNKPNNRNILAKIQRMKQNMLLKEMPKEKEVGDLDEKYIEEEGEEEQEEDIIRDEYYTTEGTMTDNDEIGDLVDGDYTHLLFGSCEYTHLKDISGTCLQITNYNDELREPKSKFELEKLFHMKALKQSISSKIDSKIKKIKKDFLTSVFEVYDRYIDRETQYDCNDIPDSEAVCETLVDAIRRHREKIKESNRKYQPILDQSAMEMTSNNLVDYSEDSIISCKDVDKKTDTHGTNEETKKELIDKDTISIKTELTRHNNVAKEQHQSESDKLQQLVEIGSNRSNYSKEEDLKRKTTEIESKLPNKEKKPISAWYPCKFCKDTPEVSISTKGKIKTISEPIIKDSNTERKTITKSLQETIRPKDERAPIQPWLPCRFKSDSLNTPYNIESCPPCTKINESSTVKNKIDILNTPQLEGSLVSNSSDESCSPCKLKNGTPGANNDNTNYNNANTIKPSVTSSKSDLNNKRVKLNSSLPIENNKKNNEIKSSKQKITRKPVAKKESKKSKDKLNKKSSLLKKQSKSNAGKSNQLIINESAVLRLTSSVLTKSSENKLKQKLDVQEDFPVNNEEINDFVEKSSWNTANKCINSKEEQNKCVFESSKDILKACIRDMYKNSSDDITIYTDTLSEAEKIRKVNSIESLVKANNMLLKKASSSDVKRFLSKDDTSKTNIISVSVSGMKNNSGTSFHDSKIFEDEDSNKLVTKMSNENSNSVDIMKVEQQITTQDYSTTLINNEREISNILNAVVKQISHGNSYSSVRGVLLKESKAERQIRNIQSFKQYDDVTFQKQRDTGNS